MKKQLTICSLIKNNEDIVPLVSFIEKGVVLVGTNNPDAYKKSGIIFKSINNEDLSAAKNELLKHVDTPWVMFIEPWERLITDIPDLTNIEKKSYSLQVVNNGIITKSIRIWPIERNLKFFNPIYETVEDKNAGFVETILYSEKAPKIDNEVQIIEAWKKQKPTSPTPVYYEAYMYLAEMNYDKFLNSANAYLFMEKTGLTATMMRYYMAMVHLYVKNDIFKSGSLLSHCLISNPLMAEFWCLMGDILYHSKKYDKAIAMYENAKIMGSQRLKSDPWPIHVVKYLEYPDKMIKNCAELLN